MFTALHMPLPEKELLTNHHEINFVSALLGTWSCNIYFSALLYFSYLSVVSNRGVSMEDISMWKMKLVTNSD